MIQLVQLLKHVKNSGRWSTWDLSRRNASDPTNSHWPKNCEVMRVLPRAQATGARDEDLTTQCIDHLSNITSLEEIWFIHIYPMFPISVKHPYFFSKNQSSRGTRKHQEGWGCERCELVEEDYHFVFSIACCIGPSIPSSGNEWFCVPGPKVGLNFWIADIENLWTYPHEYPHENSFEPCPGTLVCNG